MPPRAEAKAGPISAFFERDHREIDALFEGVSFEAPAQALGPFREFDGRLERHIRWEEGILFPAVCEKVPHLERGPIRVMRLEHEEIRRNKAAALEALGKGDGAAAKERARAMLEVLKGHNLKEEQILYPACDQLLTIEETADILRLLASAPASLSSG